MKVLKSAKGIILMCSIVLLFGVSIYFHNSVGGKKKDVLMEPAVPFSMSVNNVAGRNLLENKLGTINWWKNDFDGKYYFFLPGSANLQELVINIAGTKGIFLNEKYMENGETISVEEGEYQVKTKESGTTYAVVFIQSSNIDAFFLNTNQEVQEASSNVGMDYLKENKEHEVGGTVLLVDESGNTTYQGELELIRGRGNATWEGTDKKSYSLKLKKKADIAGMGEAKNWLLLPNAFDRSNLRNFLTYRIAQRIHLPFTTESIFVDWYVDGEYQGIYQLCEKVEIKEERVHIDDLEKQTELVNPEKSLEAFAPYTNGENGNAYTSKGFVIPKLPKDITGGYLLEIELRGRYQEEPSGFVTPNQEEIVINSPAYASKEQVNYISTYYEEMEEAILAPDGINPKTGKIFTDYLDIETFAKKYIIEELSKNVDAGLSSQFLFKRSDAEGGKLFAGPVWDYDSAWGYGGSRYGVELSDPETFYANLKQEESLLWNSLYQQPLFYYYICYYFQTEVLPITREEFLVNADFYADEIEDSVMMNFYRWNIAEEESLEEKRKTFRGRVDSVKGFAEKRMNFLEKSWVLENFGNSLSD